MGYCDEFGHITCCRLNGVGKSPKNLAALGPDPGWSWGSTPLRRGACVVPWNMSLPQTGYWAEFGSSTCRKFPEIWEYWTPRNRERSWLPHPTWVTMPNLTVVGQKVWAYVWRYAKNWAYCIPSFKVTRGHPKWDGTIEYLQLPVSDTQ